MKKAFWIVIGLLSTLMAQEKSIEQKIDCKKLSKDPLTAKENAIAMLTHSHVFNNVVKQYPAQTQFAFPLEMITLHDDHTCSIEISAYVDEHDHFALIGSFLIKGGEHMIVSKIK